MKRRRKRKLFGKRNHYRQPVARKLSTGLENLERRALLTGLVGWGEVIDGEPGMDKEEVAFEKMSQKGDRGHFEKRASVNLKKLKMQKEQQDRQVTFKQADLDFVDVEVPSGRDYQQRQGISGDYYFTPHSVYEGAWILNFINEPNSHHHQTSNGTGRTNINTFIYDDYVVIVWENPDNTIGEMMVEDDCETPPNNNENTDDGDTTSGSDGNPGNGSGSPSGGGGSYSDTTGGEDNNTTGELETPPEEGDEDLEPGDPPVAEGEGEDEDSGETDEDDEDDENEEDDEEEDDGGNSGGNSGGGNESNDVVLLPTPLDEIIIEDDTGDGNDNDSGGGGGEDEGDNETIECPDPPPGGSAPTHPDC